MAEKSEFQDRLARIFDFGTMAEIARRLDLPHATIRNYFGGRLPSPEVLIKIADATNVSLNWLLTGKGEMYAGKPKGLDIGIVLEERIAEIIDRKLSERFEPGSIKPAPPAEEEKAFDKPIVTEISPVAKFYKAEDYHQNYYNLNNNAPYCAYVIQPKLEKFKKAFKAVVKDPL